MFNRSVNAKHVFNNFLSVSPDICKIKTETCIFVRSNYSFLKNDCENIFAYRDVTAEQFSLISTKKVQIKKTKIKAFSETCEIEQ